MRPWIVAMFLLGCGGGANPTTDANPGADGNAGADAGPKADAGPGTDIGPEHPTYDEHVATLLETSCVRCHAPSTVPEARNCVRLDRWASVVDTGGLCSDPAMDGFIFGVREGGPLIVELVTEGVMPFGGPPLPDVQVQLLHRWRDDGFPKHPVNAPPTIALTAPPPAGVTLCDPSCLYDVAYVVGDPDGDEIAWSLGWRASDGLTGTFATRLVGGTGSVQIDGTVLVAGSYTLTAKLDDGATVASVDAIGSFTVAAAHNAEPTVTVTSPNGGESFYAGEPLTVTWTGNDADGPSLTYDVVALQGATVIPIATGLTAAVGPASATWTPPAVTGLTAYRIQVTARDGGTPPESAVDTSDATFSISPPPVVVSFANQIQPILTANCTTSLCHDDVTPQRGLQLTAGAAYSELINSRSTQTACKTYRLVQPGDPDLSYVIFKLQGSGPCFVGSRMPSRLPPLPPAQIQLIRDWIANGAPNN